MARRSKDVTAYIAAAPKEARAPMRDLRRALLDGAPDAREELKWRTPHLVGRAIIGGFGAFKHHVAFGFWRGLELDDTHGLLERYEGDDLRRLQLPHGEDAPEPAVLLHYVRRAAELDAVATSGATTRGGKGRVQVPRMPRDLGAALRAAPEAKACFDAFPPSKRKEYLEWIVAAKRPETRARRVATAIDQLVEGKSLHWRYR